MGAVKGAVFGLIGIGISIWGAVVLKNAKASESWPSVLGEVTESHVVKDTDRDSDGRYDTSYHAKVVYRYEVEGAEYTSDTVSFGEHGTDKPGPANEIVKRYPKDGEVKVHYHPQKPETSVLEPGVTWSSYLILGFGLVFIGGGVACCFSRR